MHRYKKKSGCVGEPPLEGRGRKRIKVVWVNFFLILLSFWKSVITSSLSYFVSSSSEVRMRFPGSCRMCITFYLLPSLQKHCAAAPPPALLCVLPIRHQGCFIVISTCPRQNPYLLLFLEEEDYVHQSLFRRHGVDMFSVCQGFFSFLDARNKSLAGTDLLCELQTDFRNTFWKIIYLFEKL